MYGYLTLEDAYKLKDQGFCVILDGDSKEAIIKNNELDYAAYLLEKMDLNPIIKLIKNIQEGIIKVIKNVFKELGQALIKIGED